MAFADNTIRDFSMALSSDSPTPGGGSVAALNGSLAASLLCMVCNLTRGKERFRAVEAEVITLLAEAEKARDRFSQLMDEDASAFDGVIAAYRMSKESDEERGRRKAAIQKGLKRAAQVPLETAKLGITTLELAEHLAGIGNPHAITDVGVAALLAEGAVWGSLLNVEVNARLLKDEGVRDDFIEEIGRMREQSSAIRELVLAEVKERM